MLKPPHALLQIKESPPDVTSNTGLSMWLCKIHNEVPGC